MFSFQKEASKQNDIFSLVSREVIATLEALVVNAISLKSQSLKRQAEASRSLDGRRLWLPIVMTEDNAQSVATLPPSLKEIHPLPQYFYETYDVERERKNDQRFTRIFRNLIKPRSRFEKGMNMRIKTNTALFVNANIFPSFSRWVLRHF